MLLHRRSSGHTLPELLILLVIVLTLIGLSIPAILKAREKANQAHCSNNLRRIGEACHGFENTYGFFPSSMKELGPQRSWAMQILPWIGEESLARQYNYEKPWYDPCNSEVVNHQEMLFYCPSTPAGPRTSSGVAKIKSTNLHGDRVVVHESFADAACSDYAVIHQVRKEAFVRGFVDKAGFGMLAEDVFPRRSDIADGLENTIMIVESAGRPDEWMAGKLTRTNIKPANAVLASRDNDFSLRGFAWDSITQSYVNYHCGACAINCSNVEGVYSFHPGGAQAVFGDGSVRFLRQTISTQLFARIVTRAGGEEIHWDAY